MGNTYYTLNSSVNPSPCPGLASSDRYSIDDAPAFVRGDEPGTCGFETRSRRPPTDPVNALLSFAYSLQVWIWTMTLAAVRFDVFRVVDRRDQHLTGFGHPVLPNVWNRRPSPSPSRPVRG